LAQAKLSFGMELADIVAALDAPDLRSYRGTEEQAMEALGSYRHKTIEERKRWAYEKIGLNSEDIREALGTTLEEYPLGQKDTFKARVQDFLNRKLAQKVRVNKEEGA